MSWLDSKISNFQDFTQNEVASSILALIALDKFPKFAEVSR